MSNYLFELLLTPVIIRLNDENQPFIVKNITLFLES